MTWQDPYQPYRPDPEGETQPFPANPNEETQAMPADAPSGQRPVEWVDPLEPIQPIPYQVQGYPPPPPPPPPVYYAPVRRKSRFNCLSCCSIAFLPLLVLVLVYFLAPLRTNLLLLGIDRTPDGTALGRSDTIILVSVVPLVPNVNMLSIPRDLWVNVPGRGENRINTAHFFAEADLPGSGPEATAETIRENFGVPVHYYVRVRFDGFIEIIRAMGGVTVDLPAPMAGLPPGQHFLDPDQALAFVRERRGADDFFRMENTQFLILSAARQMLNPVSWPSIPAVAAATFQAVDTNLPVWQWPRLALAFLRAGPDGINHQTLNREMVNPFTTDQGAQVLGPNWERINPLVDQMFGQ